MAGTARGASPVAIAVSKASVAVSTTVMRLTAVFVTYSFGFANPQLREAE